MALMGQARTFMSLVDGVGLFDHVSTDPVQPHATGWPRRPFSISIKLAIWRPSWSPLIHGRAPCVFR